MKNKRLPMVVTAVKKVLPWLTTYIIAKGYAPTIREVSKHIKASSPNMGAWMYEILEEQGYIKITRNSKGHAKSRAIKLLPKALKK